MVMDSKTGKRISDAVLNRKGKAGARNPNIHLPGKKEMSSATSIPKGFEGDSKPVKTGKLK